MIGQITFKLLLKMAAEFTKDESEEAAHTVFRFLEHATRTTRAKKKPVLEPLKPLRTESLSKLELRKREWEKREKIVLHTLHSNGGHMNSTEMRQVIDQMTLGEFQGTVDRLRDKKMVRRYGPRNKFATTEITNKGLEFIGIAAERKAS